MTPSVFLAALAAVVIWSGGPVATKLGVNELPVLLVATMRTCLGGLLVLPLVLALRIPLPREARQVGLLALSGLSSYVAFPLLFCYGMTKTSGTHGVMILAFLPVLTGLIVHLSEWRLPRVTWWLGCAIAFCGELVLIASSATESTTASSFYGDQIVFASTLFLALGYVTGGYLARTGYPAQSTTYWSVVIASLLLLPLLLFIFESADLASASWIAWAGVLYLAAGVTVAGYVLWFWAMARGGIARVSLVQFFQPISGVLIAHLLLHEPLSLQLLLAAGLIISGVAIANRAKAG
jgi:drug/metabolite transporter (DMT)-like permease